jgi:3-oxoacyl-[acyl-carrier-protein] synthase-1
VARERVAITGIGANTSLGGVVSACAAVRARLARPAQLPQVAFDAEEGPVPVVGHPVPTVAGFQGEARLLSLAIPALRELIRSAGLDTSAEVAFCVGLPDLEARGRAAGAEGPAPKLRLLDRMVEYSGLRVAPHARQAIPAGHAGFGLALGAALEVLLQGRATACIAGGVDTLCDDLAVDALAAQERLKSDDNPVGLQPGEAAAFVLLELPEAARRRKGLILAHVAGIATAEDPRTKDDPPVGEGLALALGRLAAESGVLPPGETWFLSDRNGEAVRANDWGYCQQRLTARMPGLLPASDWTIATSLGDTGAASGALATAVAVRSFVRAYAPGRCAVILSAADGRQRAAIRLERVG